MEKFNKAVNESRYRRTRFLQQYNPKMRYTQYKIVPSNDLDPLRKINYMTASQRHVQ